MYIKYTDSGFLYITPEDDCHAVVSVMLLTSYNEDFCLADDFAPEFVARLMEAGFLVMSTRVEDPDGSDNYILLPKLHLTRSALFFNNLHIKKSIKRHLGRCELRADADFDRIVGRCLEIHGDGWLTPPLVDAIKTIRRGRLRGQYPMSFALYRDGELAAGEFGVQAGRVYTSYSGYYEESNAGTVQLILAARFLQENGFDFFDLGMPLDYKNKLGAVDIEAHEFVRLFRTAQE